MVSTLGISKQVDAAGFNRTRSLVPDDNFGPNRRSQKAIHFGVDQTGGGGVHSKGLKLSAAGEERIQKAIEAFYLKYKEAYLNPADTAADLAGEEYHNVKSVYTNLDIDINPDSYQDFITRFEKYAIETDGDLGREISEDLLRRTHQGQAPNEDTAAALLEMLSSEVASHGGTVKSVGPGMFVIDFPAVAGEGATAVQAEEKVSKIDAKENEKLDTAIQSYAAVIQKYLDLKTPDEDLSALQETRGILVKTYRESGFFIDSLEALDDILGRLQPIIPFPKETEKQDLAKKEIEALTRALFDA